MEELWYTLHKQLGELNKQLGELYKLDGLLTEQPYWRIYITIRQMNMQFYQPLKDQLEEEFNY